MSRPCPTVAVFSHRAMGFFPAARGNAHDTHIMRWIVASIKWIMLVSGRWRMTCECQTTHLTFVTTRRAQERDDVCGNVQQIDEAFDDVWIFRCARCRSLWLRVLFEAPQYTKSGHWYDALIPPDSDARECIGSTGHINALFEQSPVCFVGGSFFDGKVRRHQGVPMRLV